MAQTFKLGTALVTPYAMTSAMTTWSIPLDMTISCSCKMGIQSHQAEKLESTTGNIL